MNFKQFLSEDKPRYRINPQTGKYELAAPQQQPLPGFSAASAPKTRRRTPQKKSAQSPLQQVPSRPQQTVDFRPTVDVARPTQRRLAQPAKPAPTTATQPTQPANPQQQMELPQGQQRAQVGTPQDDMFQGLGDPSVGVMSDKQTPVDQQIIQMAKKAKASNDLGTIDQLMRLVASVRQQGAGQFRPQRATTGTTQRNDPQRVGQRIGQTLRRLSDRDRQAALQTADRIVRGERT